MTYPLVSIVPLNKKNRQIRCCINFHELNKLCSQVEFSLSNIDMLVGVIAGHSMFSFTNGFNGYNQIKIDPYDVEECFSDSYAQLSLIVMLLGFKNVAALLPMCNDCQFSLYAHGCFEDNVDDVIVKFKEVSNTLMIRAKSS